MPAKIISIENSRFIFETNFSGDPRRDKYRSTKRKANLIIPDHELARQMIDEGFNIKVTKPREGEEEGFIPRYYTPIIVNYDSKWPPKVYLVSGDSEPVLQDEESIESLDRIRIQNVNVILSPHEWDGGYTLYVKTMYVEQALDDDPFAARYTRRRDREEMPFD